MPRKKAQPTGFTGVLPFTPKVETTSPKKAVRFDGWENLQKSIGTSRDPRTTSRFLSDGLIPKQSLIDLYMNDGLVRKIVDAVAEDAFRPWGTVQNDKTDKYDEGEIAKELRRLEAPRHFTDAKRWARLTGGALLYIGITGAGRPETELNLGTIKQIEFLKTFDLNDIQTWDCEFDDDPESPTFGKIILYSVKVRVGTEVRVMKIHTSRCIPFFGQRVPSSASASLTLETRYWGISVLQYMYPDIRDFRISFAATSGILSEFVVGKYKFEDLDEILAAGNEKALQTRIQAIEMTKSTINAVLMGTNEDYQRDAASVGGLADLLDRFMMMVSAVSSIPVTRLFGRSASGLNATGEGDQKAYYDLLAAEEQTCTPELERFIKMLASWKGYEDEGDYSWHWGNLSLLTSEQEANEERIVAETLRTNMDAAQRAMADGVIQPEAVYDLFWKKLNGDKPYEEPPEPDFDPETDPLLSEESEGKDVTELEGVATPGKSEISSSPTKSQL